MSTRSILNVLLVVSLGLAMLAGCGGKADENKPISEVEAEAKKLDADALRKMAETYKEAILAKQKDVDALAAKLKDIPITDMLGEKAKSIKDDMAEVTKSVSALTKRMEIYVKELKAKDGDVSGLDV